MEKESFSPDSPPDPQPESAVQRVVGAHLSEEKRRDILTAKSEAFSRQERPEWKPFEVAKTPEQQELLAFINADTNTLLQRFGRAEFNAPLENYHLLNEEGWKTVRGETIFSGGSYSMDDQAVFVRSLRTKDPVAFALVAHHETLHFKSHQALQKLYPGKDVLPYRRGFEIVTRHGHRTYFRKLDEAVIQELTNRFIRDRLSTHPLTKDAITQSEDRRRFLRRHAARLDAEDLQALNDAVYIGDLPKDAEEVLAQDNPPPQKLQRAFDACRYSGILLSAYPREVDALNELVDELYQQNRDQFANRDEVFDFFAQGVMAGDVLPAGKLIEKTFGKGSFRRLGRGEQLLPSEGSDTIQPNRLVIRFNAKPSPPEING